MGPLGRVEARRVHQRKQLPVSRIQHHRCGTPCTMDRERVFDRPMCNGLKACVNGEAHIITRPGLINALL